MDNLKNTVTNVVGIVVGVGTAVLLLWGMCRLMRNGMCGLELLRLQYWLILQGRELMVRRLKRNDGIVENWND